MLPALMNKGYLIKPEEKVDKELTKLEILHEHTVQDKKVDAEIEERRWKSCCFQLESESTKFFGKMIISLITMGLCSYQLIILKDCQYQSLYSSLIGLVVGSYLKL